jgi:predicted nicotinamide N-methyase
LIQSNLNVICGRNVLDIACHDGRWSFAATKAGASRRFLGTGSPV